jgi:hypothetical protein
MPIISRRFWISTLFVTNLRDTRLPQPDALWFSPTPTQISFLFLLWSPDHFSGLFCCEVISKIPRLQMNGRWRNTFVKRSTRVITAFLRIRLAFVPVSVLLCGQIIPDVISARRYFISGDSRLFVNKPVKDWLFVTKRNLRKMYFYFVFKEKGEFCVRPPPSPCDVIGPLHCISFRIITSLEPGAEYESPSVSADYSLCGFGILFA